MKAYLFYLSLPDDLNLLKRKYSEDIVDEFKLASASLNMLTRRYNEDTNSWIYVYAITDNKEYADIFESLHDMSLFTRIERKMDREEYKALEASNILAVLDWRSTDDSLRNEDENNHKIICPKGEVFDITDTIPCMLSDLIADTTLVDYSSFKDEYIKALDYLMYCTENKMRWSEDTEFYQYNYSYGCTAEGYVDPGKGIACKPKYISLYTKLFALLLRKKDVA